MTVVVGHPLRRYDRSAISLGAMIARSTGTDMLVVSVVPAGWPTTVAGGTDREFTNWAREQAHQAVRGAETVLAEVASDIPARAISASGRSIPAALLAQVRALDDGTVVVIGSAEDGPMDRVVVGSTADHLLHAAHVPVAVAPRGFATHAEPRFERGTCAFRPDRGSHEVLRRAAAICADADAELRVATFGVLGRTMYPPEVVGEREILDAYIDQAGQVLERSLADLGLTDVDHEVAVGRSWAEAVNALPWRHDEVLFVGSSARGVLSRVFVGSHAGRIIRHSPVPVVVVPES